MKKAWFSNWKEHHQVSADETIGYCKVRWQTLGFMG